AARIHLYGNDVQSTLDEALALKREAPVKGKKILLVTSRWHARRARWIFRRTLRQSNVVATGVPGGPSALRWWKDQDMTYAALQEPAKMLYYLLGGGFVSPPAGEGAPAGKGSDRSEML